MFGTVGSIGEVTGVPTFVQVLPLTDRWSTKAVSLIELSFQLIVNRRLLPLPVMTQVIVSALSGASATAMGRIMSISSWLRMWQCQTYSQPKLTYWLVIGAVGLPAGSTLLKPIDAPGGAIGLSRRMLLGISNGSTGMIGRRATIVSSKGETRTVSFQPSSVLSGGMMMLSHVTRLSTWTLNRWKWIGWVSTPL